MAKDINKFIMNEPSQIETCTIAGHSNIVLDGVDPLDHLSSRVVIGAFESGSFKAPITRTLADFFEGTPKRLLRSDLIQRDFMVEALLSQFDPFNLALTHSATTFTSVAVTGAGGNKLVSGMFIGSNEAACTQVFTTFLATTQLVDCTPAYILMYKGVNKSDNVGISMDGSKHATHIMRLQATPDDVLTTDTKNLGLYWYAVAA